MNRYPRFAFLLIVSLLILPAMGSPVFSQAPGEWARTNMQSLVELYVWLHKNPELSFKEEKTSARVSSELEAAGCEVTRSLGGHGVVGVLRNGDGPVILVRADMDALPITERTGRPYASKVTVTDDTGATVGVMHACGHDVHMTALIGTARYLSENKSLWKGTLLFVGQPAEERGSGANAMIDAGLFEKFPKPQACLALHASPEIPAGKIGTAEGFLMANVDSVDIRFHGIGGHGANPHRTVDPIVIAARFVVDVQTLISRELDPADAAVVTVGAIHGGTKHNIIPDDCHLQLTVRSYSDEVRTRLLDGIRRKAAASAASAGAKEPEVKVSEGTPALFNDNALTARLTASLKKSLGEDRVTLATPVMAGEDFSQFGRRGEIPVMLFWLGTVEQERLDRYTSMQIPPPGLHSAEYYPDPELSLETGIAAMSSAVIELVGSRQPQR
jgi:amidohydrolase